MTTNYVIDASILVKLLLEEEYSAHAHLLLRQFEQDETIEWLAPDLIYTETANALWKRVKTNELNVKEVHTLMHTLTEQFLVKLMSSVSLLHDAVNIADKLEHGAIYDCLYLALAANADARFVTADKKFYSKIAKTEYKKYSLFIADVA